VKDTIKEFSRQEDVRPAGEREEELLRLKNLDNLVLVDYIRSSIDILIQQKLETQQDKFVSSSRGGEQHEGSQRSQSSSMSTIGDPPKVYEELIQTLEADVRKHIRIEQQLKLHIESIEYRNEELEHETEQLQKEADGVAEEHTELLSDHLRKMEDAKKVLLDQAAQKEQIYLHQIKMTEDAFASEKALLCDRVLQLQKEVEDLIRIDKQNKKNKVSFDELEKMQPQRCPSCSNPLGPDGNSQHYKNMQMQFLDRPMQAANAGSAINNLLQVEVGKPKTYKQVYHTEKRSATNKKRGGTVGGFNTSALNASTPEKSNSQIKGLLNALNVSQSATSKGKSSVGNSRNKMKAAGALGANTVCGCP